MNFTYAIGVDQNVEYIEMYRAIAQSEMDRVGIPASITLAQGILESRSGQSELALRSNNHFGIKCGKNWVGTHVKYKDDDYDAQGNLKHSCFRKYANPYESYIAHSDFLLFNNRYHFLFQYEITDYKAWAKGLKKAGYATDKKYPSKLIKIIEKYKLYDYDKDISYASSTNIVNNADREIMNKKNNVNYSKNTKNERALSSERINGVSILDIKKGDTWESLSEKTNISVAKLSKINNISFSESSAIINKKYIYLEERADTYTGDEAFHKVAGGETISDIAYMYGVKPDVLMSMNRLPENAVLKSGEIVSLKNYLQWGMRPKFELSKQKGNKEEILFAFEEL